MTTGRASVYRDPSLKYFNFNMVEIKSKSILTAGNALGLNGAKMLQITAA